MKTYISFTINIIFTSRTIINCPTNSDVGNNTCYWNLSTTPLYRQSYEYYYFTILGENALGKSTTPIRFHHYANSKLHIIF